MARGTSPTPTPLPKVSFSKIQDEYSSQLAGVHDQQARSYGYNDFSEFHRPEHYIRYIEPLESELAVQVEYDMDEQDQEWLDGINNERRKEQIDKVSYEVFEIIMDRLEKEWFDLTKNIPKPDLALPSEDSTCAICDDSEGENTNAIVFCDGCNLAVHQDCYGVPYIPEGQWLCRKCTVSPENPVSCILCPNEGGAFKQTVHGEWVHLLCAIWVPETRVANDVFMEPVTGVDKISKQRWKLRCSVCDIREGACIQCNKASCFLAFHATCARKEKLLMPMKSSQGSEAPSLAAYCEKHLPKEQADAREAALAAEHGSDHSERYDSGDDETITAATPKSSKTARAYAKTYKPGPPLVPYIIVQRLLQYIGKVIIRQKEKFVLMVCKYWSLKREARRGAPLLKRLHLEPWTASSGSRQQGDEDKVKKLEYMKRLKADLERVKSLTEITRKRELRKSEQADVINDVISHALFPHEPGLRLAFEKIAGADRNDYFKNAVSRVDVPDYYDIIKHPMCWNVIDQKLDRHEYWDLQDFKDDIHLVLNNAMTYNKSGTPFYKAAYRIKSAAESILPDLDRFVQYHPESPQPLEEDKPTPSDTTTLPPVGNLEPPLSLLALLETTASIETEIDLILSDTPINSLFGYEYAVPKPPPPPRPTRTEMLKRKKEQRRAMLDASPGFRAPKTRRAIAAAAAFEAEVESPVHGDEHEPEHEPEHAIQGGDADAPGPSTTTREVRTIKYPHKKGKRIPLVLPGQSEVPPMVDDVDNQKSFKMFDAGWILPPDQKRGGRAPVEKRPLPPPKKRQKTEREKSHLSAFSTSAAENETLHQAGSPHNPPEIPSSDVAMSVDEFPSAEHAAPEPGPLPPAYSGVVDEDVQPTIFPEGLQPPRSEPETTATDNAHYVAVPEQIVKDESAHVALPDLVGVPITEPPLSPTQMDGDIVPPTTQEEFNVDNTSHPTAQAPSDQNLLLVAPTPSESMGVSQVVPSDDVVVLPTSEVPGLPTFPEGSPPQEPGPSQPPPRRKKKEPRNVIIIEELDTPAIRREKNQRRREERQRLKAQKEAEEAAQAAGATGLPEAQQGDKGESRSGDIDWEYSSLSELSGDEDSSPKKTKGLVVPSKPREPGEIVLAPGQMLEGGTLVWAKSATYPWWPAVVFEPDDPEVPRTVLNTRDEVVPSDGSPPHLVRFFDRGKTWQWFELPKLRFLGEDSSLDEDMIAPTSKKQRWKNTGVRKSCRDAYRRALAEMETNITDEVAAPPVEEEPPQTL